MNLDEERKAFEEWFFKFLGDSHKANESHYICSWNAWQAAKANEAERLKGCVTIPVEPTDEIIEAMDQFDSNFGYADMRSAYKAIVKASRGGK